MTTPPRQASDELVQPASPPWVWLLFSLPFTIALWFDFAHAGTLGERALTLAFIVSYTLACPLTIYRPIPWRAAACVTVTAVTVAHVLVYGHDAMVFSYPIVLIAILLPWHWAAVSGGGLALTVIGVMALRSGGVPTQHMLLLAIALTGIGIGGFFRMAQQLKEANATIAALAVHEDRERIARDLHDALGAGLTTLTVKAGLARRLLESGSHEPALAEVREVEQLGRRALDDVRAAVRATGALSMATALADARRALRAAGIAARLPEPGSDVPDVFAHVLREGVTNVVRHSAARTCEVRLGAHFIEIRDDGGGNTRHAGHGVRGRSAGNGMSGPIAGDGPMGDGPTGAGPGHGLTGLSARVEAHGGTLSAAPSSSGGFVLRADLPAEARGGVSPDAPGDARDDGPAGARAEIPADARAGESAS